MDKGMNYNKNLEEKLNKTIEKAKVNMKGTIVENLLPNLVSCDFNKRVAEFSVEILPNMKNGMGITHGGVTATIFDNCMGLLSSSIIEEGWTPTVNLQINYIKPVMVNSTLHITVRITSLGKTLINVIAEAWDENDRDRILATATAVFFAAK